MLLIMKEEGGVAKAEQHEIVEAYKLAPSDGERYWVLSGTRQRTWKGTRGSFTKTLFDVNNMEDVVFLEEQIKIIC
jgi:hypothetical protein